MGDNKKSAASTIWWGIVSAFCNHNYYKQVLKRTFIFLIEQNISTISTKNYFNSTIAKEIFYYVQSMILCYVDSK